MKLSSFHKHRAVGPISLIAVFLAIGIILSCGRPPEIHYYTVEVNSGKKDANHTAQLPYAVGIVKFDGGVLYTDDRIIYRESPYEVKFWHYRRWIAPPNILVTEAVREYIKAHEIFRDVVGYPSANPPHMLLTGKVKAFEEIDKPEGWYAKVALQLTLTDLKNKQVVWEDYVEATTEIPQKQPASVVESINRALNQCLEEIVQSLRRNLKNEPAK